jgi:hypothetical protein
MTDQEIIDALVRWLRAKTGQVVIQADQSGDEPAGPYVVVRFTGSAPVRDQIQDVEYIELDTQNSEGKLEVEAAPVIEMEWRYSVHAHGQDSPSDLLRPIRSAAELAQISEPLFPGLIIHELSQIRNVPEFVNEDWEPRAQMDLILRGLTKDGFKIDTVEEFSLDIGRA